MIPSWVYFLFLILLLMGLKACFKRVVKVKTLIIMPLLFLYFSIKNIFDVSKASFSQILFLAIGLLLGIFFGYLHGKKASVRADKDQHFVELPGDWTILLLMMLIFAVQFVINYLLAVDPALTEKYLAMALIILISGITSGMVVGRNLIYFYKFTQAPSVHLELTKFKLFKK